MENGVEGSLQCQIHPSMSGSGCVPTFNSSLPAGFGTLYCKYKTLRFVQKFEFEIRHICRAKGRPKIPPVIWRHSECLQKPLSRQLKIWQMLKARISVKQVTNFMLRHFSLSFIYLFLFIYGLYNDTVSMSVYITLNSWMNKEL
jgi:hypothetical protein